MEMIDIMYELANTKSTLEIAGNQILKLKGKCFRKNVVILGLLWFGATACKLLGESDKKLKAAEEYSRNLEIQLAHEQQAIEELNRKGAEMFWADRGEETPEKDICCDGKASIDKKEV